MRRNRIRVFSTALVAALFSALAATSMPAAGQSPESPQTAPSTAASSDSAAPATSSPSTAGSDQVPLPPQPSSLADVARKLREQRQGKSPGSLGKVTNADLASKKTPAPSGTPAVKPAPTKPAAATGSMMAATSLPELKDDKGRSEADWRRIVGDADRRVEAADKEVKRLEDETNRLQNDFYAWSDGNYRDRVIKVNWDAAREALKKAKEDAEKARMAREDLDEEARKSRTPPGWLR